jgi:iron(III) transport system ATP-binding protein
MVFQNYALFPHLSVFENVAFGLRSRKRPAPEIRERVEAALARVDLAGYGGRAVQALSGGQQQRVALARALAIEPPLLLLDEPLSNLDQALRVRTRAELRALVRELGITAIFVTHDQEEAFDLSDRIAVMREGRIRQVGSPRELYHAPGDRFVAGFVGRINQIPVTVEEETVLLPSGARWPRPVAADPDRGTPPPGGRSPPGPGDPAVLLARPEALAFVSAEAGGTAGTVRDRRFRGAFTLYRIEVEGLRDQGAEGVEDAGVIEVAGEPDGPAVGERVRVRPREGARLHLFPREAP